MDSHGQDFLAVYNAARDLNWSHVRHDGRLPLLAPVTRFYELVQGLHLDFYPRPAGNGPGQACPWTPVAARVWRIHRRFIGLAWVCLYR